MDGHPLAVDERVRVRFRAERADGWLALGLCDERACSAVRFDGLQPPAFASRITRSNSVADEHGDLVDEVRRAGHA